MDGRLCPEGRATLPRKPKGVGSLLTSCRLAFLSGLVGEAAEGGRGKNITGEKRESEEPHAEHRGGRERQCIDAGMGHKYRKADCH